MNLHIKLYTTVEIKRLGLENFPLSDIYKWLVIHKESSTVWELDFQSMTTSETEEFRTFVEGSIKFDQKKATFSILNKEMCLNSVSLEKIPQKLDLIVKSFLANQYKQGNLFSMRGLRPSDIQYFNHWIFDQEVIRYSMTKFQLISSKDQVIDWYYSILTANNSFQLGMVDPKTNQLIGYAGIAGINKVDHNGEYFIFIGNKNYWGKGIASEVTKYIVEYGFTKLKLHRIFLTASSKNLNAIKAYESAGFHHEGKMRDAFYRNDEYSDKIIMGVLENESAGQ